MNKTKQKLQEKGIKFFHIITGNKKECFLKILERPSIRRYLPLLEKDIVKTTQLILKENWLGGDKEIQTDSEEFLSAMSVINKMFESKDATIKKEENYYIIKVDKYSCKVRKPNISELGTIISLSERDPIKSNEVFLDKCWLSGDEIIKTQDDLFFGVSAVLGEIITFKNATLKKN